MNILKLFSIFLISFSVFGVDVNEQLNQFESKLYSIKTKGVKDLVVEVVSDKLTKELNDYKAIGKIDKLIFKIYWTSQPERIAVEVEGLPEGFREIKENLKSSIPSWFDYLNPPSIKKKFSGYDFFNTPNPLEIICKDKSGLLPIPSFTFKFNPDGNLLEVVGNRHVGSLVVRPSYDIKPFSSGKLVLSQEINNSFENGQTLIQTKLFQYQVINGIGLPEKIEISQEQQATKVKNSTIKTKETIHFSNYKINEGIALKYFLGEIKN